jgi:M3 family oligoendopeptidase
MQKQVDFSEITAETPTFEQVVGEYKAIYESLDKAQSPAESEVALRQWDELRRRLNTWTELTHLRFHQDTQNESYKTALNYCDELTPKLTALEVEMQRRLLGSPHRPELERVLGKQAFLLWEALVTTFDPVIEPDLVQEAKLTAEYTELLASAQLDFEGNCVNLEGIRRYIQDADRDVRYRAQKARWDFFSQNQAALDRIYHDLVQLRHKMARKLGYDNYIALGYRRMRRVDYGQAEVERYREQVAREVVPLANQILQQRAEKLNLDELFFWDESVFDLQGNPEPKGDRDWMLERFQEMFDAMSEELGDFCRMMVNCHLLDLKNRPGKAGGGFCTGFLTYEVPFIFANFNSTKSDVEVFTHEMGHAFQMWQSRHLPVMEYLWPTLETCEIHSMSLEFLSLPHVERFFGADAQRYRTNRIAEALLFLPYGVAVDHFQHLVYAHPDATPKQRNQMWQQMEALYLPWRRYGDLTHPAQGGLWQEKQHISCLPFYYIDYALAMCCAFQFWVKAESDYNGTLSDYIALCRRGGEAPFQELTRNAKLVSPFEPGALTQVVEQARQVLML